ncbi:helix-turn-helix domain-containing protein [Actinokineospora sp.]|uniref:helix-turn-helix domain-containing protein n=1 Tax=Actinokineospora sp. TaxID=1872133 RepID=UPI004037C4EC
MTTRQGSSRARALAAELKELRARANLTTRQAAKRIGISSASLNRVELGFRLSSPEEVSALLVIYDVTGVERERVLALARESNATGWWEVGRSDLPKHLPALITFESQATRITNFEPSVIPGLLQTNSYSHAIMRRYGVPDADANARVSARAGRQTVLTRKRAPRHLAIMDEATFHRPFGGRAVMAEQIRKLIDSARLPNVTIQVIPFDRGGYPIYGPYAMLEFGKAPTIVFLEHKLTTGFLDKPEVTDPIGALTVTLTETALGPAESIEFLAAMATRYERE